MIFEDDNAVIGAPGPLNWRGAVYVAHVPDDELSRDHRVYQGLGLESTDDYGHERTNKFGYTGKGNFLLFA